MQLAERYRAAGVDLDAAQRAKARIAEALARARTELGRGAVGAFGGMVRVPPSVPDPVLVMSTDGVGTKVLVGIAAGRHNTIGVDLVNHCVNDILVHGARPIAFQDYIAMGALDVDTVASLVEGVSQACREHDMTLAGGETAEMPDLYQRGHYDLAGTIVGVVSESAVPDEEPVQIGDLLIGYASTGLHTNGYTLARRIVFDDLGLEIDSLIPELNLTVADALLAVHQSYHAAITPVLRHVHGLAHITGGGIPGNLVRSLPAHCGAVVNTSAWPTPELFAFLEEAGHVDREEMFRVFNMGIGMIAVAPNSAKGEVRQAAQSAGIATWVIGEVVAETGVRIT